MRTVSFFYENLHASQTIPRKLNTGLSHSRSLSGTLHPNCQDSNGRPRRDIGTILQILNDLLSATRHYQGMPPSLTQLRYQTQCGSPTSPSPSPPPSPPVAGMTGLSAKATSVPAGSPSSPPPALHPLVQCQSQISMCKPPGEWLYSTTSLLIQTICKHKQKHAHKHIVNWSSCK